MNGILFQSLFKLMMFSDGDLNDNTDQGNHSKGTMHRSTIETGVPKTGEKYIMFLSEEGSFSNSERVRFFSYSMCSSLTMRLQSFRQS